MPGLPVLPPAGALIELVVLVSLILLADWEFPAFDISNLEPSPYWLPVLLLSLQYGTVAGLLAAAAATACYVFNGVAEQAVGENYFTFLLRIWALPILWIGVALVLGQFRLRQIAEKQELRVNLAKRSAEARNLAIYADDLAARVQRLEREIATQLAAPNPPILDALAQFVRSPGEGGDPFAALTSVVWPDAQVSVFAVSPAGCSAVATSGWPQTASWATDVAAAHPLYRAIVSERRAVSILKTGDELVLSGHGVAACAILTPDGARVAGMLKIESIDPKLLTRQTQSHMDLIARLVAPILAAHMSTEPRVVVDNTERHSAAEQQDAARKLTRGWTSYAWHAVRAQTEATASIGNEPQSLGDGPERAVRPKRLN